MTISTEVSHQTVAVIIVVFNTDRELLERCIASISDRNNGSVHELDLNIVIHDNSANESLRTEFQHLVDEWHVSENIGFASAVNFQVGRSNSDWILLLNPDAELRPHAISELKIVATEIDAGALYCCWLCDESSVQVDAMMNWVFSTDRLVRRSGYRRYLERNRHRKFIRVQKVSGGATFARREILVHLGPYDERYFLYGEDSDLSYRARRQGVPLYVLPGVQVVHSAGSSQDNHSTLVERARSDAAIRLSSYQCGYFTSLLFRLEFLIVTMLGVLVSAVTSSRSPRARLARVREITRWGVRHNLEKWSPCE